MKRRLPVFLTLLTLMLLASATLAQTPKLTIDGSDPEYQDSTEADDAPVQRVARITFIQGDVSFLRAGVKEWSDAVENLPLLTGDQIYVGSGGRAEIQFGRGNYLRLTEKTALTITELSHTAALLEVTEGIAMLRLERYGSAWDRFEVDTPNSALLLKQDGLYRINVRGDNDSEVIIHRGSAEVSSADGTFTVREGQRLAVDTRPNGRLEIAQDTSNDDWDRWSYDRDRDVDTNYVASSPSYVTTYETNFNCFYGVDELSSYGSWSNFANYGYCWIPRVGAGWAPYRNGQWHWIPGIGWTWLAGERWGWAPYHYGRWVNVNGFWAWSPGFYGNTYRYGHSYYQWRPALVGFFNYPTPRGNYVGWYPLSVGQRWRNPIAFNGNPRNDVGHGHLQYPTARDSWRRPDDNNHPRIGNGATVVPVSDFGGNRRTNRTFEPPNGEVMNWANSRAKSGLPDLGGAEGTSTTVWRHGDQAGARRPVTPPADVIMRPVVTRTRPTDTTATGTPIVPRERRVIGAPTWRKNNDTEVEHHPAGDSNNNGSMRPRIGDNTGDITNNRRPRRPDDAATGGTTGNNNEDSERKREKKRERAEEGGSPTVREGADNRARRPENEVKPNEPNDANQHMRPPREERNRQEKPPENNGYRERPAQPVQPVEPQRSREERRQEKQERREERVRQEQPKSPPPAPPARNESRPRKNGD